MKIKKDYNSLIVSFTLKISCYDCGRDMRDNVHINLDDQSAIIEPCMHGKDKIISLKKEEKNEI